MGHRCKRELQILILLEDGREEGDARESSSEEVTEAIELSSNSIMGLTKLGTMKIKAKLGPKEVTALIDCGAIHNFLSMDLVEKLGLPVSSMTNYAVVMGTGVAV